MLSYTVLRLLLLIEENDGDAWLYRLHGIIVDVRMSVNELWQGSDRGDEDLVTHEPVLSLVPLVDMSSYGCSRCIWRTIIVM
jgi:hypothetical protein